MKTFIPKKDNVKVLGRADFYNDTLWMVMSGSGAEFTVTGKYAAVTILGDSTAAAAETSSKARIGVYLNDKLIVDDMIDEAAKTYTVADGGTVQEYRVKIVKLSEAAMSTCGLCSIETDDGGILKPAEEKKYLIEFIGDSITCGYGVEDEDENHDFSTETENVTKAYAYKTAKALDADYSMVSLSGYGIISGYTEAEKLPEQTIPQYYEKLGYSLASYQNTAAAEVSWDFTKREPDLVVINLGTNDDSYTGDLRSRQQEYTEAYVRFLKKVRKCNPHAEILCTLGIMGDRLFASVEEAAAIYGAETGDTRIGTMKFDVQLVSDGYAANWHPTETTHNKAAKKLTAKIKDLMDWNEKNQRKEEF